MFQSIEELVDENDRRSKLYFDENDSGDTEHSQESVPLFIPIILLKRCDLRQERAFRGYNLLIRHVPGLEVKLINLDVPQFRVFVRDVSQFSL